MKHPLPPALALLAVLGVLACAGCGAGQHPGHQLAVLNPLAPRRLFLAAFMSGSILGPTNTTAPVITGEAKEGKELTASHGAWTESPSTYAYQWERCNNLPGTCKPITGASTATLTIPAEDLGFTLRVLVTAKVGKREGTAVSKETLPVEEKEGTPSECFGREEACGYPGPNNTGVQEGVTLTRHPGTLFVGKEGETIKNLLIEGALEIKANNVTVENVEVIDTELKRTCSEGKRAEGSGAVQVQAHGTEPSTGVLIKHITVHGVTQGCPEPLGEAINIKQTSNASAVTVEYAKVYWVGKCFHQTARWEHDYCDTNAELPPRGEYTGAHYDGLFDNGEGTITSPGLIARHDTILMPHWQTAPLFLPNEKEVGEERIENNLLAGGGYLMYLPGASGPTHPVKGPIEIIANRLARCTTKETLSKTGGHHLCEGLPEENETTETPLPPDTHGYFPKGGSYGVLFGTYDTETDHFSGNYWDNNLEGAL